METLEARHSRVSLTEKLLKTNFIGQNIRDVDAPAAVIDIAKAKRNCQTMLQVVKLLGVKFRAHIKTHKTSQLTELQVGDVGDVRLVVSTVAELEHILPWLISCLRSKRNVDVLYGIPPSKPALERLQHISKLLFEHSKGTSASSKVSVLVDNAECLYFQHTSTKPEERLFFFIKIDSGYGRAGVKIDKNHSEEFNRILNHIQSNEVIRKNLAGLYSHLGSSYNFNQKDEAIDGLLREIETLEDAAANLRKACPVSQLCLSVGATPTATAAQNLVEMRYSEVVKSDLLQQLETNIKKVASELEIHAGVYPLLDLQQLATHARPATPLSTGKDLQFSGLSHNDIAIRILADVVSRYERNGRHEALVAAGTLALGREPCKNYPGWGVIAPWRNGEPFYDTKLGWMVGRISQEHGILTWEGDDESFRDLPIGTRVAIWPNHACIAGAMFDWYLIVDSDSVDENIVRDVWIRCRGW